MKENEFGFNGPYSKNKMKEIYNLIMSNKDIYKDNTISVYDKIIPSVEDYLNYLGIYYFGINFNYNVVYLSFFDEKHSYYVNDQGKTRINLY